MYRQLLLYSLLCFVNAELRNVALSFLRDSVTSGYFFEDLNILISTFCVCADGFKGLFKSFHYPIQLLTFYLLLCRGGYFLLPYNE